MNIPVTRTVCALLLTTALAAPALAAPGDAGSGPTTGATTTNDAGSGPTNGAASGARNAPGASPNGTNQEAANTQSPTGGMRVAQKVRDDLTRAGFTDIHVMPSSFLVRARDSSGNPVMMVINPDSIAAITDEPAGTSSALGSTARPGGSQTGTPGARKSP